MKTLAALILISPLALGQTVECVEVPDGHKVVFVPWFVPIDELVWKWHPAKLPKEKQVLVVKPKCERTVTVSPDIPCD